MIQEIRYPASEKPVKVVIFHWLPGDIIGSQLNLFSASYMGEMMAALHLMPINSNYRQIVFVMRMTGEVWDISRQVCLIVKSKELIVS